MPKNKAKAIMEGRSGSGSGSGGKKKKKNKCGNAKNPASSEVDITQSKLPGVLANNNANNRSEPIQNPGLESDDEIHEVMKRDDDDLDSGISPGVTPSPEAKSNIPSPSITPILEEDEDEVNNLEVNNLEVKTAYEIEIEMTKEEVKSRFPEINREAESCTNKEFSAAIPQQRGGLINKYSEVTTTLPRSPIKQPIPEVKSSALSPEAKPFKPKQRNLTEYSPETELPQQKAVKKFDMDHMVKVINKLTPEYNRRNADQHHEKIQKCDTTTYSDGAKKPDFSAKTENNQPGDDPEGDQDSNPSPDKDKNPERFEKPAPVIKHPLKTKWTLWYFTNEFPNDWERSQVEVYTVASVEDFWALVHYTIPPTDLRNCTDYSFFREGIKPMWEDPRNRDGGRWLAHQAKQYRLQWLDQCWHEILMLLIGDNYEENLHVRVNGAVLNVRAKGDKLSVWLDTADVTLARRIGYYVKKALCLGCDWFRDYTIHFERHSANQNKKSSMTKAELKL